MQEGALSAPATMCDISCNGFLHCVFRICMNMYFQPGEAFTDIVFPLHTTECAKIVYCRRYIFYFLQNVHRIIIMSLFAYAYSPKTLIFILCILLVITSIRRWVRVTETKIDRILLIRLFSFYINHNFHSAHSINALNAMKPALPKMLDVLKRKAVWKNQIWYYVRA
jgi:hypothetical protein